MWGSGSCMAGALVAKGSGWGLCWSMSLALEQPCSMSACSSAGQAWQRRLCLTPAQVPARQPCTRHVREASGWTSVRQKVSVSVTHRDHEMWLLRYGWSKAEVGCWNSASVAACHCTSKFFQQPFLKGTGTAPSMTLQVLVWLTFKLWDFKWEKVQHNPGANFWNNQQES